MFLLLSLLLQAFVQHAVSLLSVRAKNGTLSVAADNAVTSAFSLMSIATRDDVSLTANETRFTLSFVASESLDAVLVRTASVAKSDGALSSFDAARSSSRLSLADGTELSDAFMRLNFSASLPVQFTIDYDCTDTFTLLDHWSVTADGKHMRGRLVCRRDLLSSKKKIVVCLNCAAKQNKIKTQQAST